MRIPLSFMGVSGRTDTDNPAILDGISNIFRAGL